MGGDAEAGPAAGATGEQSSPGVGLDHLEMLRGMGAGDGSGDGDWLNGGGGVEGGPSPGLHVEVEVEEDGEDDEGKSDGEQPPITSSLEDLSVAGAADLAKLREAFARSCGKDDPAWLLLAVAEQHSRAGERLLGGVETRLLEQDKLLQSVIGSLQGRASGGEELRKIMVDMAIRVSELYDLIELEATSFERALDQVPKVLERLEDLSQSVGVRGRAVVWSLLLLPLWGLIAGILIGWLAFRGGG